MTPRTQARAGAYGTASPAASPVAPLGLAASHPHTPPSTAVPSEAPIVGDAGSRIALFDEVPCDGETTAALFMANGHTVFLEPCAEAFLEKTRRECFDLLVIRWRSQSVRGMGVLRSIRSVTGASSSARILVLTERNSEFEVVQALESGADDCATQPGRPLELLARVNMLLRVHRRAAAGAAETLHGFTFVAGMRVVEGNGLRVQLAPREFELARLLFRSFGSPVSRAYLFESLWGSQGKLRTVDQHIGRIRRKLGLVAQNGFTLQAIYGVGYVVHPVAIEPPASPGPAYPQSQAHAQWITQGSNS